MYLSFKKFIKDNFPQVFKIVKIILGKNEDLNIQFQGWGLTSNHAPPWIGTSKNKTYTGFKQSKEILLKKINDKDFFISQFQNEKDIFNKINSLDYRHYVVYYTSLLAFNNTKNKNIVECGVCDGLTVFFAIQKYKEDLNYKAYLYDSWSPMKKEFLISKSEDKMIGKYDYLNIENTKNNLKDYQNNLIFNKGYIPESFNVSNNPDKISWLHIDLNSSIPTDKSLEFFYPLIESKGIILFDDYGWKGYEETREIIENFFEKKTGEFFHLPTGQAFFIKN